MDCSALLALQSLRVLSVEGWRLYITLPPHAGSIGPALMLTELSTNTWSHEKHEGLLAIAMRGGEVSVSAMGRVSRAAAALVRSAQISHADS